MPTFAAVALDRLLEPGASNSIEKSVLLSKLSNSEPPKSSLEKRNTKPVAERTASRPQISSALYAIPKAIPLPDSPSSFPPSPYVIDHKVRGPRIVKSFSEDDVSSRRNTLNQEKYTGDGDSKTAILKKSTSAAFPILEPDDEHANGVHGSRTEEPIGPVLVNGSSLCDVDRAAMTEPSSTTKGGLEAENGQLKAVAVVTDRDGEGEDFYDPGESMSLASNSEIGEDAAVESLQKLAISGAEFYDACEELSSDSGMQTTVRNVEAELSEIRLSLLTEIEKRKQSEEALSHMRTHWQRIKEQLAQVGVFLPADPTAVSDSQQQPDINVAEELCHQFNTIRFVSDSIGRGIAKAEVKAEMEAKLEVKNFEIARLSDKLHYYEAVNHEMSQRNQEATDAARRVRQRRKIRQRWVWGPIAATITLGSAALVWSYLPPAKSSSSTHIPHLSEAEDVSK